MMYESFFPPLARHVCVPVLCVGVVVVLLLVEVVFTKPIDQPCVVLHAHSSSQRVVPPPTPLRFHRLVVILWEGIGERNAKIVYCSLLAGMPVLQSTDACLRSSSPLVHTFLLVPIYRTRAANRRDGKHAR